MSLDHRIIKSAAEDNVGIVTGSEGLKKGVVLKNGICVIQNIPMGHKVALCKIDEGERIIRYGHTIGFARETIEQGAWIEGSIISEPVTPELNDIPLHDTGRIRPEPLEGYTFLGYRNRDGSVGTKNVLGVATTVQCVAGLANYVVKKIKQELLPKFHGVDDVVALTHTYGCGVAIDAPAAIIPIRTIKNILTNPNFGGEVMVVGLGCEKLRPEHLKPQNHDPSGSGTGDEASGILFMQDETLQGFDEMVQGIMKMADTHLKKLNRRKRETCPVSELVVGMQCGGSDAFSGITANPVAGYAADLIIRAGGSVLFSEVTEVRDAVHLLVPRTINAEVRSALLDEMKWFDDYLKKGQVDRSANTSPGNKEGGLSNIVEKALGSIVKSGTSPIVDVLGPGEKVRRKGLTFAATPASDFVCGTLQLAAGMNLHLFTTGRGSPYGLAEVPVIKVGSNTRLSNRWFDLIDLDAGEIVSDQKSVEEMGWELFHLILDVASGKKQVACDKLGLHNDLVLFNPGPLT
jgi:galactarate dehydratase